jgi:regulator of nucleoside diphosphate kinase
VNDQLCILTAGDFSTLKTLHEQWSVRGHGLAAALRKKLEAAQVVFPDDLPRDVASLGSQIAYATGDDALHIHTLTCLSGLDREWLSICLPAGLALLGQREGRVLNFGVEPERSQRVTLHRVLEQPEASWPGRFSRKHAGARSGP